MEKSTHEDVLHEVDGLAAAAFAEKSTPDFTTHQVVLRALVITTPAGQGHAD